MLLPDPQELLISKMKNKALDKLQSKTIILSVFEQYYRNPGFSKTELLYKIYSWDKVFKNAQILTFLENRQNVQLVPLRRYKKWYRAIEERSMTEPVISTTLVTVLS